MVFFQSWTILNPNNKKEFPPEAGDTIADPWLVVRGLLWTEDGDVFTEVTAMTPPITGRLERMIVIPDHLFPGVSGPGGTITIEMFQEYSERDLADGFEFADTLELLAGLGAGLPNNAISHLHAMVMAGTLNPIIPQILVQDRLRLDIADWGTGDAGPEKREYVYLYFSGFSPSQV